MEIEKTNKMTPRLSKLVEKQGRYRIFWPFWGNNEIFLNNEIFWWGVWGDAGGGHKTSTCVPMALWII